MDVQAYVSGVCKRLHEAERIPFIEVIGEWRPKVGECHNNVTTWVTSNAGSTAVRGWVTWYPVWQGIRLTAHSVVRGADGHLFDITPLLDESSRVSMRFVAHTGDEPTFFAVKAIANAFDCIECGAA